AGGAPTPVPLDDPVRELAPSPDGRWLALSAESRLLLLDRTQAGAQPSQVMFGQTRQVAWSADGQNLAALGADVAGARPIDPARAHPPARHVPPPPPPHAPASPSCTAPTSSTPPAPLACRSPRAAAPTRAASSAARPSA